MKILLSFFVGVLLYTLWFVNTHQNKTSIVDKCVVHNVIEQTVWEF